MSDVTLVLEAVRRDEKQASEELVWSKQSCGFPVIEFQQTSQTLTGVDLASGFTDPVRGCGKENHVLLALVVPFRVVMGEVIFQAMPQRALPNRIIFDNSSVFTDLIHRSQWALE